MIWFSYDSFNILFTVWNYPFAHVIGKNLNFVLNETLQDKWANLFLNTSPNCVWRGCYFTKLPFHLFSIWILTIHESRAFQTLMRKFIHDRELKSTQCMIYTYRDIWKRSIDFFILAGMCSKEVLVVLNAVYMRQMDELLNLVQFVYSM